MELQATLTSKGRITLPVALRRKLRLKPGDVLELDEKFFRKARPKAEVKRTR
jgi:AbrB family looped-hinge helix DNA binding protein